MIISHDDWDLSEKGKKDAERHHEKIDDAIRKNVRDVIAEESIITKKRGRKVRIPVRGLKDYRFVHGQNDGGVGGVGQGDGEPGDVIDSKKKQQQPGKPGDQKGSYDLEAEVDIDYLIKIMFEDLGLPWIEEKTKAHMLVPKGWKFETTSKKGIFPRLHKKRTLLEAVKRMTMFEAEIMKDTGCSEEQARKALIQAYGDLLDAIEIVQEGKLDESIDPNNVQFANDDLRYKVIEPDVEIQSQAVVICMMDVSGSMDTNKKYLARSMLFWLVEFLKKMYDNVEVKFIIHTTDAKIVDEHDFFHTAESGGTYCGSAFEKANWMITTEFPIEEWNVYCVYISDGEDWEPKKSIVHIDEMLKKDVNMLSYVEIKPDGESGFGGFFDRTLLKEITDKWTFKVNKKDGTEFYTNEKYRFLLSIIKNREHVYPCLKHMLFERKK